MLKWYHMVENNIAYRFFAVGFSVKYRQAIKIILRQNKSYTL